jgi:hypothetical protein
VIVDVTLPSGLSALGIDHHKKSALQKYQAAGKMSIMGRLPSNRQNAERIFERDVGKGCRPLVTLSIMDRLRLTLPLRVSLTRYRRSRPDSSAIC